MSFSEGVGCAVDLGTTTMAASLIDMATGEPLAAGGALNPQRMFGSDVVTRLSAAVASEETRREMTRLVNLELERLAAGLLRDAGIPQETLRRVAIAGNPAMEHLLMGLPVDSLARIPYRPMFTEAQTVRTAALGWAHDAETFIFPLPGGFVGGDLVAFLYGMAVSKELRATGHDSRLYLDLGTNAEIALSAGDHFFATSAAAGPAFEGGNLSCGMTALSGAIQSVEIVGDRLKIGTTGDARPAGVCGSGAISAIVALLASGVLESDGRLRSPGEVPTNLANRIAERDGSLAFILHRDAGGELLLTQNDIRQVQLAKGAVRAGIEVLLERAGADWDSVGEVLVTGSFGSVLHPDLLGHMGIVPPAVTGRVRFIDGGALSGCRRFLMAADGIGSVEELAGAIRVVPLSGNPKFEQAFLRQMDFAAG